MALKGSYVRARIDADLKEESEAILDRLGLTTAEAIRLFLVQVRLRNGLPFNLEIPRGENDDLLLPSRMRQAALDSVYED
jgi:DNA-damage-inducible protein J